MGVYSFVFGWKLSLWFKTNNFGQFLLLAIKKEKNLSVVLNDIRNDLRTNIHSRSFTKQLTC